MVVHPPRLVATEALVGMEAAGASLKTSPLDDQVSSETLPTDDVAEADAAATAGPSEAFGTSPRGGTADV